MKVSRHRTIPALPETVWRIVSVAERMPKWYSGVETASHVGGPVEGVGRRQSAVRDLRWHRVDMLLEVVAWEPRRRLDLRHVEERIQGRLVTGVRNFVTSVTIAPQGEAASVTVEYRWRARFGIPWLQSLLVGGRVMGRELDETLRRLEAAALKERAA
ncbi:MAG: hypothetical protein EXR49_01040 [Dehalococcoidia bacterium]|nr:hypothetical protein [Dehalococcoidia bacterium]